MWRKSVRRGKMGGAARLLNESIRFLPTIVPTLSLVHGHCDDLENARLISGVGPKRRSKPVEGFAPRPLEQPFRLERFLAEQVLP